MLKKKVSQRGSALMLVTIIVLILSGISGAYLTISWWNQRRGVQDEAGAQALFIAESAANQYIARLNASGGVNPTPITKTMFAGGYYWVPEENIVSFSDVNVVGKKNLDPDFWSFQVAGRFNGVTRRLDVLVSHKAGGVFWNAIFAGNDGKIDPLTGLPYKDPKYQLDLGGTTSGNADIVKGDIYSANDIKAIDQAQILNENGKGVGKVTYGGDNNSTVTGNYQQGTEPSLDIKKNLGPLANMNEAEYNAKIAHPSNVRDTNGTLWVDVDGQFTSKGTPNHKWSNDGSVATDITDPKNPAHFLRKNPTSNGSSTNRTKSYEMSLDTTTVKTQGGVARNDYYIEDPVNAAGKVNNLTDKSLTGMAVNGDTTASMLNILPESNNAVYFIDGNMRVSGENVKSYQFNPQGGAGDIKMTFVVKGNVSLTDNLLYPNWESAKDVVAIIAIKDDVNWPNSSPADFAAKSGTTPVTPNGVSIDSFVTDFNKRANNSGGKILPLDLTKNASDISRASQEYNKIYGSGNVFFGDPGSGTVEHFEAFMYAENNFYATGLDADKSNGGTNKVEIYGNMTAGNQVTMDRSSAKTGFGYVPLRVTFDPAIRNGNPPPWMPPTPGVAGVDWHINSWKQSARTAEFDAKAEK